ncbi:hypothetical protein Bca4012_087858 [Brassica carinata]
MFVEDEQLPLQLKIEDKLRASVKIHPAINLLQFIRVEVNFSVSLYQKGEGEFKIVNGFNERKTFIVKFKRIRKSNRVGKIEGPKKKKPLKT